MLDSAQEVTLTEACRAKDRLDQLDQLLRGEVHTWVSLARNPRTEGVELRVDTSLGEANQTATTLKRLLASLRLPDGSTGRRPQRRGARGVYLR